MTDLLHRPALDALLDEATSPQRWRSRNDFASTCGITPSTLSNAIRGGRPLSEAALTKIIEATGWPREALILPVQARRGDLETTRLTMELKRLREDVARRTDEIAAAIRERGD